MEITYEFLTNLEKDILEGKKVFFTLGHLDNSIGADVMMCNPRYDGNVLVGVEVNCDTDCEDFNKEISYTGGFRFSETLRDLGKSALYQMEYEKLVVEGYYTR